MALTRALAFDSIQYSELEWLSDVAIKLLKSSRSQIIISEEMAEPYPIGRIGQPEEIAHVIALALSHPNSYMTGSIVPSIRTTG